MATSAAPRAQSVAELNNYPIVYPASQIEASYSMPQRTRRVELPEIGVEDMLAFDWKTFMNGNAAVAPEDRADVFIASKMGANKNLTMEAPAQDRDSAREEQGPSEDPLAKKDAVINVLTQNIAEIRESIQELKETTKSVPQDHAKVVSDALLALTKTGGGRKRSVSKLLLEEPEKNVTDKKKIRMQRNRQSAAESRERKRMHTEQLEGKVKELTQKNTSLEESVDTLKNRVRQLEAELGQIRGRMTGCAAESTMVPAARVIST